MRSLAINLVYDLLELAGKDTTLRKTGAGWYAGACPFCGGNDRFVLKQTPDGWRWYCRFCGDDRYHTAIDYIMKRENLNFHGALDWVGGGDYFNKNRTQQKPMIEIESPKPSDAWQGRGMAFIESCESALWSDPGSRARAYLNDRGLKDDTLKKYRIGYNPQETFEGLDLWGLPEPDDGKRHAVWLPRGIVIPCLVEGALYYLKFRRPLTRAQTQKVEQKYIKVKGSKPGIFGADTLRGAWLALLTEGEFDQMLLDQEAGDLAGCATLGSATDRLDRLDFAIWGKYILPINYILAAYDQDGQGAKGSDALEEFTDRAIRAPLPDIEGVKDITDLWKIGRDLGDWVCRTVENIGLL